MTLPNPSVPLIAADEMARAVVDYLRADPVLHALLFPGWSQQVGPTDTRVYSANVELPQDPAVRAALPRVLIEVLDYPFRVEQSGGGDLSEVPLYVHTLAPKDREEVAKTIDAHVTRLLVSTPITSARIIAAKMSRDGLRQVNRASGFDDAWEVVTRFVSPLVGVTA